MVSPPFSKSLFVWLFSLFVTAACMADTIGEAKVISWTSYLARRDYPIIADRGSPGRTGGPGRSGGVDPRFVFQATCAKTDEGPTWSLSILLNPAGWTASPPVTTKEYLALVDQGLDRFMKDVPDAKVDNVTLDLTGDSEILADILEKLRPRFQAMAKSPPPAPSKPTEGIAIEVPPGTQHDYVRAANDSAATQRLGTEIAGRLGRKYLHVVNSEDLVGFDHRKGPPYGKTWAELLKDPHLGIELENLQLVFILGPLR